MKQVNDPYVKLYVKKKKILLPLIAKYSDSKISAATTHGEAVSLYLHLLKTNVAFKTEVDAAIRKELPQFVAHNAEGSSSGGGIFSQILGTIGSALGTSSANKTTQAESDAVLYQAVLESQGANDTTKILVVSGVALLFVGIGVYMVMKTKKG
jgi:hypothetical protein